MIEIKLNNIKCPICNKHSFLKIIYDETNKLYSFKCDKCGLESVPKFTDSINLFKNFEKLKCNRRNK